MAVLTTAQADKLNRLTPTTQEMALGTSIKESQDYQVVVFTKAIAATAATAVAAFVAPFALRVLDVIVKANFTETNGTLQPLKGTDAMCTAIVCAADGALTHMVAGAVVANDARLTLAAGDTINLIATGTTAANVRGHVTFICVRV